MRTVASLGEFPVHELLHLLGLDLQLLASIKVFDPEPATVVFGLVLLFLLFLADY